MPAILVECCFISSDRDMRIFEVDEMAQAIANGIIGKKQISEVYKLQVTTDTYLKPTTEQLADLDQTKEGPAIKIPVGNYIVEDAGSEEGHYWVKWFDDSQGGRHEHFVSEAHSKLIIK